MLTSLAVPGCRSHRHWCFRKDCQPAVSPAPLIPPAEPEPEPLAPAQLTLTKEGPQTAGLGEPLTYTITVANTGEQAATGVVVRDPIPVGVRLLRSSPEAQVMADSPQGETLVWDLGTLAGGQQRQLTATVQPEEVGTVINRAEAESAEGLRSEASATTQVVAARLRVEKTAPQQAFVGESVTFDITVTNEGQIPATNLVIIDTFGDGLVFADSPEQSVRLDLPRLDPGGQRTYPLTLRGTRSGPLRNEVVVTADGGLEVHAEATVLFAQPRLSVTKTGPRWRFQGRPAEFNITVRNDGDVLLRGVRVVDQLAPQLSFVRASAGGQPVGDSVVWELGDLEPGQAEHLQVEAMAQEIAQQAINQVRATADGGVEAQSEAMLEVRPMPAGLDLYMFDENDPVFVGEEVTYQIVVQNKGGQPAAGVQLLAILPDEMTPTPDAHSGPTAFREEANRVTFAPGMLPAQQRWQFSVKARAVRAGDARFQIQLTTTDSPTPIIEEESTVVLEP